MAVSFSPAQVFLKNVAPRITTSAVWTALLHMDLGGGLQHVHAAGSRGYAQGQPVNYFLAYQTMEEVNHAVQVLNGQVAVNASVAEEAVPPGKGKTVTSWEGGPAPTMGTSRSGPDGTMRSPTSWEIRNTDS